MSTDERGTFTLATSSPSDGSELASTTPPKVDTRGYQQEMLEESLKRNIIIALDTGAGKTHIAILRMLKEVESQSAKVIWFFAPTVALCEQQRNVIKKFIPVSVGLISGSLEPDQWRDANLWRSTLSTHRIMVTTPQVLLDALRHSYVNLGRDIGLIVFDEAHHAVEKHPYNVLMQEFYFICPPRTPESKANDVVRPMVLGLTASPIFGGNVAQAFQTIEANLDSVIRAPQRFRQELLRFVHRPVFKHAFFNKSFDQYSTNLSSLQYVIQSLDVEQDPWVIHQRKALQRLTANSAEWRRIDQKLSITINKRDTFVLKGLRDFERTASVILETIGAWAADWYVVTVIDQVRKLADPFSNMVLSWRDKEKKWLLEIVNQMSVCPISYFSDDIEDDCTNKLTVLIDSLLIEKQITEEGNEFYSGIVFVERRDAVIALGHVLAHHPRTKGIFKIGRLVGSSDTAQRHSFLDITRYLLTEGQSETLEGFRIGDINLLISTAVAEEGIDIQACCNVTRWDPPQNMASWTQSRGRARRQKSTFVLLFEDGENSRNQVERWHALEQQMVELYNDPRRAARELPERDVKDVPLEFRVEKTGALLTLDSAIGHLAHFCAVIPATSYTDNRPIFEIDPPELPEGWHSFNNAAVRNTVPYPGPFGSKVTLPRLVPLPNREFVVERIYPTKSSAHRHAAFAAYKALYEAGLLNDNLLPLTSVVDPENEEEVKGLLREVEKREGMAAVSLQMDPWAPPKDETRGEEERWWCSRVEIEGCLPLLLFTRAEVQLRGPDGPTLYRPGQVPEHALVTPIGRRRLSQDDVEHAQDYTRRLFWVFNGMRMKWEDVDFCYLFLPESSSNNEAVWKDRRSLQETIISEGPEENRSKRSPFLMNAQAFAGRYGHTDEVTIVKRGLTWETPLRFIRWRFDPLSEAELEEFREHHPEDDVAYPLLEVERLPNKINFLAPHNTKTADQSRKRTRFLFLPRFCTVLLFSKSDISSAILLPSILRWLSIQMTVISFQKSVVAIPLLESLPTDLLTVALTAPSAQAPVNYQRLETLGDTALKFVVSLQILAEFPLWHEGYLAQKKDHTVSNVRLAKANVANRLYKWIIRDTLVGRKWKPRYFSTAKAAPPAPAKAKAPRVDVLVIEPQTLGLGEQGSVDVPAIQASEAEHTGKPKPAPMKPKKVKKSQDQLSTKVLADVVESLIGAAYLHGGLDLSSQCINFFALGIKWAPIPERINQMLSRVPPHTEIPAQIGQVEKIIGYTFTNKLLVIEALTHVSYQQNLQTPSYERLEFLGDSVLDMIVTDYLYRAPNLYSPGHIHMRRSAVVNAHILAFFCLRMSLEIETVIPIPDGKGRGKFELHSQMDRVWLWQCLLHSSHSILEDQANAHVRFHKRSAEIEEALERGKIFPWAALTRLQAPKFFSDIVESLIGAVYLDSKGDMDTVRVFLRRIGILPTLERIVKDDLDVLHPVSRLSIWGSRHQEKKKIRYEFPREKGEISCAIYVDGKEEVRETEIYRGTVSQTEVKLCAAESAIKLFHLRDEEMEKLVMGRGIDQTK